MLASGDLLFDLYGAAVSETEQRGVELCMAGRFRFIPLAMQIKNKAAVQACLHQTICFLIYTAQPGFAYLRMIASATFIPSIAADVIPPAYPAPSPHG